MNMKPDDRIKLCIVSPRHSGGGAEYQIGCLIDVLATSGRFDIYYLARYTGNKSTSDKYSYIKIGQGEQMPAFGYAMDVIPLYQTLRRIKPAVIYQRVGCGYTGICGLYSQRYKVPFIWHVAHDSDVKRLGNSNPGRNVIRNAIEKRSVEFGLHNATHIVVQKQEQATLLQMNYGRKATALIPNFQPVPIESIDKSGSLTVVWVANIKPWKHPEIFIRLAAALQELKDVRFVMVGEIQVGARERDWLNTLMHAIEAAPNLEYVGALSQAGVNELLARSHVFVNTSEEEGFPNTFIQAWMREVVVASMSVDPDGVLEKQRMGVLAGTEHRLRESIRSLLSDDGLRRQYVQRSKAFALQRHSIGNADLLADLISEAAVSGARYA